MSDAFTLESIPCRAVLQLRDDDKKAPAYDCAEHYMNVASYYMKQPSRFCGKAIENAEAAMKAADKMVREGDPLKGFLWQVKSRLLTCALVSKLKKDHSNAFCSVLEAQKVVDSFWDQHQHDELADEFWNEYTELSENVLKCMVNAWRKRQNKLGSHEESNESQ